MGWVGGRGGGLTHYTSLPGFPVSAKRFLRFQSFSEFGTYDLASTASRPLPQRIKGVTCETIIFETSEDLYTYTSLF